MAHIGFVGLGHMGLPMAMNLIRAGHVVTGFDLQPAAVTAFTAAGGQAAHHLVECAHHQEIIITMLQTGQQVQNVYFGAQGLLAHAKPGTLAIDCSTIDVQSARAFHQRAEKHQLLAVDAPVSGGVAGATAATLTFMVGGSTAAVAAAQPILAQMGKKIIHTGEAGNGQAAKICNNMILGSSMIAIAEAFLLAKNLGLTPQKLHEVVSNASGQCWVMDRYVPVAGVLDNVPANHQYQAGFTAAMMLKDLNLSQQSAQATQLQTPLAAHSTALYQQLIETGKGELDFSVIIELLQTMTE